MSIPGNRLWGLVAYESLDHNGSKFFLISKNMVAAETHASMPMQCLVKVN